MPLALTLAVGTALTAATAGTVAAIRATRKSPSGKGVFIRSVRHAASPAALADACAAMGLSWVAILLVWQEGAKDKLYHLEDLPAVVAELRARKIRVWLWAWPEPGRAQAIVDLYAKAKASVRRGDLSGLILDPEKPYYSSSLASQAELDVATLRTLRVPLGCTTYGGGPPNHPRFPWAPWSAADFGMPQIYDTGHQLGLDYPERSIRAWQEAGFSTIVPVWGASNAHTPADMADIAARTPRVFKAAAWWDFYWLQQSAKRAQAVANYRMPKQDKGAIA